MKNRKRLVGLDIVVPFLIMAVVFGSLVWQKYRAASDLPDVPPSQQTSIATKTVVLFFADDQGRLVREAREVESCQDKSGCLRLLLEELFSGPLGDSENAIPEWATINDVRLEGSLAVVDLGADFVEGLASGSSAETLAVYAIVNTISVNLPEVKQVRLLIDGADNSRLRHLDISGPIEPDFGMESPATRPVKPAGGQQMQQDKKTLKGTR